MERRLADSTEKYTSQISKLSSDLELAYNAACYMHTAVCRPQGTPQRGSATAGCTTVLPDFLREVKAVVSALYVDLEKCSLENNQLSHTLAQLNDTLAEEVRKHRAAQAEVQMQLETQLRNVADKDASLQSMQSAVKDLGARVEELEKLLRNATNKLQENADEKARLETQRDDLKNGNATARDALRKAAADIAALQAKIDSLSEEKIELDRDKRDALAQIDDRDFRLAEVEKQLNTAAVKCKESELEIVRLVKENKALSAAAAHDRDVMEEQIQMLTVQARELQGSLADTSSRLEESERALRASEKRNEERIENIHELEKRLKAAKVKEHELVDELAACNAELNKVKNAALEAAKQKDETISKLQDGLQKERLRVDELSLKLSESDKARGELKTQVKVGVFFCFF